MSLSEGSLFLKLYNKTTALCKFSGIIKALKTVNIFFKNSTVCKFVTKFPGDYEKTQYGLFKTKLNTWIVKENNIKDKIDKRYQSGIFASWLNGSNFLLIPVLYFLIDYILRSYIGIDVLSSYWDDAILAGGFCLGIFRSLFQSKSVYGKSTPLSVPILLFISFFISLMLFNSPKTYIGIEGVRAVTQYMLWYFVAVMLIQSYADLKKLYYWFLIMGTALALHGIYQFVMNVPMPPGWVDMAEKGVRTRAFSIIGSPNILGSVMTLLTPMAFALFLQEKKLFKKAAFGASAGLMSLCLIFTQSRGAWIGFIVAIMVFFLIYDKRLIVPVILIGVIIFFTVPQVYDRITYMLSKEYIMSSLMGGRLVRWQQGLDLFKENTLLGLGIGRFGGAVAMNHKDLFPDTYYMDNYYLKLAVEGGIFALISFILLMVSVVKWSLGAIIRKNCKPNKLHKVMITGMFSGLSGIIAHNLVENVFEVPAMVTYFWIVCAMIMFLGFNNINRKEVS